MSEKNAVATDSKDLLTLTAQIVSAYAARTTLTPAALNDVIGEVLRALGRIGAEATVPEPQQLVPAVPIKKSVSADFIVCLEDGKKLKMLKRHLMSTFNMTPAEYRTKWNLPRDYPMTAPNYAATRSQLAKKFGLGRSPAPGREPRSDRATRSVEKGAGTSGPSHKDGRGGRAGAGRRAEPRISSATGGMTNPMR